MARDWWDTYFKLAGLVLVLLLIIFDNTLGLVYTLMLFVTWIWHKSDKKKTYKLVSTTPTARILVESLLAFGIFTFSANYLLQSVAGFEGGIQAVFQLLSTSTPILQGSKILTLLGWGVIIPFVETILFFVIIQEGIGEWYGSVTNRFSLRQLSGKMLFVLIVVSLLFVVFHLTAKQLQTVPLLITFVFAMVSGLLVMRQGDARGAILIHVAANSLAVINGVF